MTIDLKTLAAKAFDTPQLDEFYARAKDIWNTHGIPPHLLGGEDDNAGIDKDVNLISSMAETGQYQKVLKLLEHPEETGLNPLYTSSLGYTLMHRLMRSNYNVGRNHPEQALELVKKLHELGVPHETYTKFGDQCIHLAARRSSPEVLSAYLTMIKDINSPDIEERNALHCIGTSFSFNGPHQYNWDILIAAGANPFNCDNLGRSVSDTIEHFSDPKVHQYMQEHFIPTIKEASLREHAGKKVSSKPKVRV